MGAAVALTVVLAAGATRARAELPEAEAAGELRATLPPIESARPRHTGRALLLNAGLLAGGTIWYWRALDFNSRDWDLKWNWTSWKQKLSFEQVRFDQNLFQTNAVSHARAGLGHYHIARGNGFSFATSAAATFATSVFWEYLIEFREQPSINDLTVNTVAGVAIGEPFYRMGEFLLSSAPNLFNRGIAAAISPVAAFNDLVDRRKRPHEPTDSLGFNRRIAHRFEVGGAVANRSYDDGQARIQAGLDLDTELVGLRGYGRPGRFARWTSPGDWTAISGQLELDDRGVSGGALYTRTSLLGRYQQDFGAGPSGDLRGLGAFAGLGSAFEYEDVGRPGGSDYLASMDLVGPLVELVARRGGLRVRWLTEAYGSFTMVKALAFAGIVQPVEGNDVYRPGENGGRIPGVVGARGYHYALGAKAGTRLALEYLVWDLGAELRAGHFDSIAGFDRFRDELVDEVDIVDQRVVSRVWLGIHPWTPGPRISGTFSWRHRRGEAEVLAAEYLDRRFDLRLSLVF